METVTRSREVLKRNTFPGSVGEGSPEAFEIFEGAFDDTQKVTRRVSLSQSDWAELGSPEQITVTIEPGDTLSKAV